MSNGTIGNRYFWAESYYVSTAGLNEETIKKYIKEQEAADIAIDKLSVKEYEVPFRGNVIKLIKKRIKISIIRYFNSLFLYHTHIKSLTNLSKNAGYAP